MGCTSSAPNTIPLNANTADKSIQLEEETKGRPSIEVAAADGDDEDTTNDTKVLPACDTTEQSVQLVRNYKSNNSLATVEKDIPANGHVVESEGTEAPANTQDEVTIPKLELFMDKVFETNLLNGSDSKLSDLVKNNEESPSAQVRDKLDETMDTDEVKQPEPESTENDENDENTEEGIEEAEEASPTQSQSSRATRWEALADIAAELPPSLAVDPLTGQIYQLALPK